MNLFLPPALVAAGFLVCDGVHLREITHGKLGTQATRILASPLYLAGALYALPSWWGVALGLGLVAGIWAEQNHGEGQRARADHWMMDARDLAISGVTRLAPAALAIAYHDPKTAGALLFAGLVAKPCIWFLSWRVPTSWPTRIAAGVFGALVGLVLLGQ